MTERDFSLRRSASPYLFLGAIFIGISVWISADAFRKRDVGTIESAIFLLGIYALYVLIGTRYQISIRDNTITQRAFGKSNVSIPIVDITSVDAEVSDARTWAQMNRPFRRIVINANTDGRASKIDISTKHFHRKDVRKLMRLIHTARPNLTLPKQWLSSDGESENRE